MRTMQNVKIGGSIFPQSITDTDTNGTGIDRTGWNSALLICTFGAIGAADVEVLEVQESDDNSSYADVTAGMFTTVPVQTDDNKHFAVHLDLRGRKKYLRWHLDPGNAATLVSAIVILGDPEITPTTAAERGCSQFLIG